MAGLDGIQNKIHPGEAADKNLYDLPPEEDAKVPTVAESLEVALAALKADHDFLLKGGVFTKEMLEAYIELKTEEARLVSTHGAPDRVRSVLQLLNPALAEGDQLNVLLDGKRWPGGSIPLDDTLDRGSHIVEARVVNSRGEVQTSTSATFTVQQTSVQSPVRKTKP
jgi:hypothetical protein